MIRRFPNNSWTLCVLREWLRSEHIQVKEVKCCHRAAACVCVCVSVRESLFTSVCICVCVSESIAAGNERLYILCM